LIKGIEAEAAKKRREQRAAQAVETQLAKKEERLKKEAKRKARKSRRKNLVSGQEDIFERYVRPPQLLWRLIALHTQSYNCPLLWLWRHLECQSRL
jgi:hypothetical protein